MTAINGVTDLSVENRVAVITVDAPPSNALSTAVRAGLQLAFTVAAQMADARAIVLICAGKTFLSGADHREYGRDAGQGVPLRRVFQAIEAADKPVVAAIHGSAQGCGLELALACHHRVAVWDAGLALPEVRFGLIPGAGGTQRLPRLVGAHQALRLLTTGAEIKASEARHIGLIDAVFTGPLRASAIDFARIAATRDEPPVPVRDRMDKLRGIGGDPAIVTRFRTAHAARLSGRPAAQAAIRAVEAAMSVSFDAGLAAERRELLDLARAETRRSV